ncbi:MFS family permease [Nocardia transvalensis]|uniref:MFS family permease n=1 Tax=Nocardia transvalensis TaxID=37333 RepID=A0A7W9PG48_9NOCA|nr:MFS family permease [Nocardia transvalensis]
MTLLALPLAAIGVAGASTRQVALLSVAGTVPNIVLTPLVGSWLDSRPVLPVMFAANVFRAIALLTVPAAYCASTVNMPLLYVVAAIVGALTAIFDIAVLTAIPRLARPDQLVAANGRVNMSTSFAETAGPALGGFLVQLLSAPFAILADVASYMFSSILIRRIAGYESAPEPATGATPLIAGVWHGIRYCFRESGIRALLLITTWFNIFEQFILTVFLVYAVRALGFSATLVGVVLTMAGAGALAGALTAGVAGRRYGVHAAMIGSFWLAVIALAIIPIPTGSAADIVIGAALFVYGFGLSIFNVHAIAYRQSVTPATLQGSVNAGYRTFVFGALPIGAGSGAVLSQVLGLRGAMGGAGATLIVGAALFSYFGLPHFGGPRALAGPRRLRK